VSLASFIQKHNKARGLAAVLIQLNEEDQEALLSALGDSGVGSTAIARGLREIGVNVDESSVRRWREKHTGAVELEEAA
jgi:uroporphyrinogen-III synthase